MGGCMGKSNPVHPLEPRGVVRSLQSSKGSHRIKVLMTAKEFEELASQRSDAEIGQLIIEGCLRGRWQATPVGHACSKREFAFLSRSLEPIMEEELG